MAKLTFTTWEGFRENEEIMLQLAIIDEAKAKINAELAKAVPGMKAQHSYKLDFATKQRVFKVAYYPVAQATVQAQAKPTLSLQEIAQRAVQAREAKKIDLQSWLEQRKQSGERS